MFRILACALACSIALSAKAAPLPLTAKDISLMLRSGYSSKMVLEELSHRRFADTLDTFKENQLIYAGASPELLLALRGGTYTVSADEVAKLKQQVQQQKEFEAKRRAAAAEEARKFDTLHQSQLARDQAAEQVRRQIDDRVIYHQVKGDLVQYQNGSLSRFDDAALEGKKLFLIYFSAHWCPPCRLFTPTLVNYYNDAVAKHPELDLIFVSRDKSSFAMETYMRDANMRWPAIDYEKISAKSGIQKYAGKGIPDLVLVDSSGKVLADSYQGDKYVGPAKVLEALSTILTKGATTEVAQAR
jgi:nucleoredoxin